MLKKTLYFSLSLFFLGTTLLAEDFSDVTERKFEIQGTPDLVLKNADGVIQISPREGSSVEIKITRKVRGAKNQMEAKKLAEKVSLDIEQIGNQVRAITRWPNEGFHIGWHRSPNVDVRYEVFAPVRSDVRASVSDGELYIMGLQGTLELNTSDGNIVAEGLSGDLRITASDGDVVLKQSNGVMRIDLSDGDLRAENCSGQVRIRSGDGTVELPGFTGEAEISNGDGDIFVDGLLKAMNGRIGDGEMVIKVAPGSVMSSNWSLTASDGGILLELPDDFSADLEVTTSDGRVETDHPVSVIGRLSSRHLMGKIRDGGHLLQIRTSDGNVAIK